MSKWVFKFSVVLKSWFLIEILRKSSGSELSSEKKNVDKCRQNQIQRSLLGLLLEYDKE